MKSIKKAVFAACIVAAGFSTSASAAIMGIVASGNGVSSVLNSTTAPLGANIEFTGIGNAAHLFFDFDPAGTQLKISTDANNALYNVGTLTFTFSNTNTVVTGLNFNSGASMQTTFGANNPVVGFTANSITLNLSALQTQNKNSTAVFNLTAPAVVTGASVPEPTSIALLGLGLLGFAAARRKSAK